MFRKILPAFLILLSLIFLQVTNKCFGDVTADVNVVISKVSASNDPNAAAAICKSANEFDKSGKYEQSRQLFQYVVDKWPSSEPAMWSQMHLAMSNIRDGNDAAARAATDKLIADYSGYKPIARAVCQIADQYYQSQRHQNADKLYQKIVEKWPDTGDAMWAQMHIAMSNIRGGNETAAQAATDKLIANHSGRENIAKAVCFIADYYCDLGRYKKANELYQQIIDKWPDAKYTMWAQCGVAKSNIFLGDEAAAQAAIDKLLAGYSGHVSIAEAACKIADQYSQSQKYQQADRLYQKVVERWPGAKHAMWAQSKVIRSHIRDGNDAAADEAFNKLLAVFSDQPTLPEEVIQAANAYSSAGRYDKADKLYQYVIDKWSKTEHAIWAKTSVVESNILLGNEAAAEAALNNLIADFNNCPDLPMAVSLIAEQYYANALRMQNEGLETLAAGNYQKSIIVREIIIQKLPFSDLTPRAYYFTAVLYSQYLGQYQKGIEYFQKVVDNWPSYQFAWNAQFFIGLYYEKLRDSGQITALEANPKIEQAYRGVVEKYPDSEPALYIALRLARENFEKEQWQQAVAYFEFYLGKFPDQFSSVVLPLGRSYEKMGEPETAIELYRAFIELADSSAPNIRTVKARLEKLEGQSK